MSQSLAGMKFCSRAPYISSSIFTIYIYDLLAEFEEDTFVSAFADLLIARNKDMIVASLQLEVDKVVAWSDTARLTHDSSKY